MLQLCAEVSGRAGPSEGTLRMLLFVNEGGRYAAFPSSSPAPLPLAALLEMLTQSGEQLQKPQESPREEAGREGEVELWNALAVTYLQAELSEPSLSQPLPPPSQSVPPLFPTLPSVLFSPPSLTLPFIRLLTASPVVWTPHWSES